MTDKPENPPAFPHSEIASVLSQADEKFHGMTLRDYFAGQAIAGMKLPYLIYSNPKADAKHIAEAAYIYADEMLKASSK